MNQGKARIAQLQVAGQVAGPASCARGRAKSVDWAAVELGFRAGTTSLRQLADEHGVTHKAIQKRAAKYGWTRDLKARIKVRAAALVAKSVATARDMATENNHGGSVESGSSVAAVAGQVATRSVSVAAEERVVEANAALQAEVLLQIREDLKQVQRALRAQIGELDALNHPWLQEALEEERRYRAGQVSERKAELMRKAFDAAMDLHARVQSMQRAISALSTLIERLREDVGVDRDSKPDTVEDAIIAILKLESDAEQRRLDEQYRKRQPT